MEKEINVLLNGMSNVNMCTKHLFITAFPNSWIMSYVATTS